MTVQVFVYGTLMTGQRNHGCVARWVATAQPATVNGLLYQLPYGYPAVVQGPGKVHGELLTFAYFGDALAAMDRLEGYEGPGQDNFYERIDAVARLQNGSVASCFMYVFAQERKGWLDLHAVLIQGGDWLDNSAARH